jgi:hypothetical protein
MSEDIKLYAIYPLGRKVTVSFAAAAATTLYTVPTGYIAVIDHVDVVAGADAAATTVTVGRSTALTDFLSTQTLSNLDAAGDKVELRPIQNATPVKQKTYAAGVIIQIDVQLTVGGATNYVWLWGYLYAA